MCHLKWYVMEKNFSLADYISQKKTSVKNYNACEKLQKVFLIQCERKRIGKFSTRKIYKFYGF